MCDLCCIADEFACGLYEGVGSGGFPCEEDGNHGWLVGCILCDVLGNEELGELAVGTLKRPWPWKL